MKLLNPSPKSVLKKYPEGSIFQGFGENPIDYAPVGYPGGHPGWDILAYQGAPIVACTSGNIYSIKRDPKSLGGLVVWLSDGVNVYGYGHLQDILVTEGQQVNAGDLLGHMGNTGFIISGGTKFWGNAPAGRGVHLHFGITPLTADRTSPTGGAIDPTPFFAETIKPEIPDPRVPLLIKLVELYRSLIRLMGKEPIA